MVKVQKHTDILTQEQIVALAQHRATPCVSIYMPTVRKGPETRQNAIRLKNLLTEAEKRLNAEEITEIEDFLTQAYEMPNTDSWKYLGDSLAIFMSPGRFEKYRLPLELDEAVVVDQRFYIRPLIPIMNHEMEFYIVALDQDNTRLLHCTPYSVHEVEMPDTPRSLSEAMRYDLDEKQLQFHSATAYTSTSGTQEAAFHGQSSDEETNALLRFLKMVENGVYDQVGNTQIPLILVGLDSLQGLYRRVNSYNELLDDGVNTTPAPLRDEEMQSLAWERLAPRQQQVHAAALSNYQQLVGKDDPRVVTSLEAVVPAAYYERVDTLFVKPTEQYWGRFVPGENKIETAQQDTPDNTELIDFAIAHTWTNGGHVYTVESLQDTPVAAILRY